MDEERSGAIFSGMAANGTPAASEPITLERLKAMHLQLSAIMPLETFPDPVDVHPETFSALRQMAYEADVKAASYCNPGAPPIAIAGITLHVRIDVTPGAFHPCTCKEKGQTA